MADGFWGAVAGAAPQTMPRPETLYLIRRPIEATLADGVADVDTALAIAVAAHIAGRHEAGA